MRIGRLDTLPSDARRLAAVAAEVGTQPVAVLAQLGPWARLDGHD